ncbi:hypothetical protein G5B40_07585 [Pikeienuella piscinae]|uniref:Divergent polysaccharide deacetylase n=1 Tax=Pikeienuella piscinae TaxID=2748098 RepID=A0A7L5C0G2_9RHOB|nr:divergent polysaccharide deacetylase family protein [Pikeienuella piscinae]QIE55329.1 hypothetical protein G5B40_07585 [Pikeienuella piscinae]
MARRISGRGAFWLGALVGLIFSVGLVAALSIMAPRSDSPEPAAAVAPAPEAKTEIAPAPELESAQVAAAPAPAASPPAEPDTAPAPEVTNATAPTIMPEPSDNAPESAEVTELAAPAEEGAAAPADEEATVVGTPGYQKPAADPLSMTPELAETAPLVAAPAPEGPRYEVYAAPFDGDDSQPLLAILLTGVGGADAAGDVMLLDGPVAISIAPDAADPAALAQELHSAGYEALAGRTEATAAAPLDDAGPVIGVALLDVGSGLDVGVLLDAVAAENAALVDLTAAGGAAPYRMAHSRGLPAASEGRRIDEVANSDMVYQALERAAFDARRTGAFVAVGEASPAVIAGVRRWLSVKGGVSVEVAPLSAVIAKIRR